MRIHTLDLGFQGFPECIAAFLVRNGDDNALVETGPETTIPALVEGLAEHSLAPGDIQKVLLTHIHLDHAGAAGWWAEQGASIYVHERGARHLADPSRLWEGARSVYGDRLEPLWGGIRPVPESQIHVLRDGDRVAVGNQDLVAWDTPGHARHHLAFVGDDFVFSGDLAGVRLPGQRFLSPATAPPQFDPAAYDASLQRLEESKFDHFYLTHFGVVDDCLAHVQAYRELLQQVAAMVRKLVQNGASSEVIQREFTAFNRTRASEAALVEPDWERYEAVNPSAMCADGIRLFCELEVI